MNIPNKTIFSINPITGEPYLEFKEIERTIKIRAWRSWKCLIWTYGLEEVLQVVHLRLAESEFDDSFEPWLFVDLVAKRALGTYYKKTKAIKNTMLCPDAYRGAEGEVMYHTDSFSCGIDPETILLAREKISDFVYENLRNAVVWGDDMTPAPEEYKGVLVHRKKSTDVAELMKELLKGMK